MDLYLKAPDYKMIKDFEPYIQSCRFHRPEKIVLCLFVFNVVALEEIFIFDFSIKNPTLKNVMK